MYSLWLMPKSGTAAHTRLTSTIKRYADEYEDAPRFPPHLTVLGRIDVDDETARETVRALAAGQAQMRVRLTAPHCSTTRFQCVYLLAEPTQELLALHRDAEQAFARERGNMYVPHVSLIYSHIPIAERRTLLEAINLSLPLDVPMNRLCLTDVSGDVPDWSLVEEIGLRDRD